VLCSGLFLPAGNKFCDPALKDASFQQDTVLAPEAFNPDIGAKPDYLPFIAAAGVPFFEADDIAEFYLHNHIIAPAFLSL